MSNYYYYYGLTSELNGIEAIQQACSLLPNMKSRYVLMLATAKAETDFGQFRDTTHKSAGEGWFQFDPGNVADVQNRMNSKNKEIVIEAYEKFDFYMGDVDYAVLRQTPQASAFMTAFKYWLVPHALPEINDIDGMWWYYKVWFNSRGGKTTETKFKEAYGWALQKAKEYPI